MDNKSTAEIATKLNLEIETVTEIEGRPMRFLRQSDFTSHIDALIAKRKEIESITSTKLASGLMEVLTDTQAYSG